MSAFCAFVAASVAQGEFATVSGLQGGLLPRSQAAAGWLIFVTVIAMLVEGALIATRFLNFGFVATTIFQIVVSPPPSPSPSTHTHTHTHTLHIIGMSRHEALATKVNVNAREKNYHVTIIKKLLCSEK